MPTAVAKKTNKKKTTPTTNEDSFLIEDVALAVREKFPKREGKPRFYKLYECSGVVRYRVNWWDNGVLVYSRFLKIRRENGKLIVTDETRGHNAHN